MSCVWLLKIWVETKIIKAKQDAALLQQLEMADYKARIERLMILTVQAYDWNCPQHFTPRYTVDEIKALTGNPSGERNSHNTGES